MKYPYHIYAKALVAALYDPNVDQKAVSKNFLALVSRNGDELRLKKILDEAARLARGREARGKAGGAREVMIESARKLSAEQKAMVRSLVHSRDVVVEKIDPALVAGVKITVNDEMQFDGTMKAKLDMLFTS